MERQSSRNTGKKKGRANLPGLSFYLYSGWIAFPSSTISLKIGQ